MNNTDSYEWARAEARALARYVQPTALPKELAWPRHSNRLDLLTDDGPQGVVEILYKLVREQKINYNLEPFNPRGNTTQYIRKPAHILTTKEATCLDLAVLFAALGLANDLWPIIVAMEGHAFVGFALKRTRRDTHKPPKFGAWENGQLTDADILRELAEQDYFFVEGTGAAYSQTLNTQHPEGRGRASNGAMSFERACEAGREHLNGSRAFLYALDIHILQTLHGFEPQAEAPEATGATTTITAFDQRGQNVHGPQTNIAGGVQGPVFSGQFHGPVTQGDIKVDSVSGTGHVIGHGSQSLMNTGSGAVATGGGVAAGAGGVAVDGNVQGNIVLNQGIAPNAEELTRAFAALTQRVNALPEGPSKTIAQQAVQGLQAEAKKGDQANEKAVGDWFNFLAQTASDAFDVAVATFTNPIAGLGLVFKKVAERAKAEREKK